MADATESDTYEPPTSLAEVRRNDPYAGGAGELLNPTYGEEDDNGFVGVSPEYSNAANDTDAPGHAPGDNLDELAEVGANNQFEYEAFSNDDTDPAAASESDADPATADADAPDLQGGQTKATVTEKKAQAKRLADQQKAGDSSE